MLMKALSKVALLPLVVLITTVTLSSRKGARCSATYREGNGETSSTDTRNDHHRVQPSVL
jgi:hypothetical protein